MRKIICLLLAACLLLALAACGGTGPESDAEPSNQDAVQPDQKPADADPANTVPAQPDQTAAEWTREGFFADESGENMLSISWMDLEDESGWYVGCLIDGNSYGGIIPLDGGTLSGSIPDLDGKELTVTASEEGDDGVLLVVEGGEAYRMAPMEMPEATIYVSVNVEGDGNIDYAEGETAPEIDTDYPYQSAQINLAEPATHTFVAWPDTGWKFVKWTKDGQDFSTEAQITLELAESADYVAVFDIDGDGVNPLEAYAGRYDCERAHAEVDIVDDFAFVTIEWGSSAWESSRWLIGGQVDLETLTLEYSDCSMAIVTYNEDGELESEETQYDDGTGTVVFNEDGTFTWHDDQSEYGVDLVFTPSPAEN